MPRCHCSHNEVPGATKRGLWSTELQIKNKHNLLETTSRSHESTVDQHHLAMKPPPPTTKRVEGQQHTWKVWCR